MFYKVKEKNTMSEYMTIKEAAEYLKVTGQTLRNWDKLGKLKPYRHPMNNYRLYKKADLDKILKSIKKQ
ncbi:MAG: MerR family DNA-binding transcriptional regulator [Candidatus Omnitrophota bacterium]